MDATSQAGARPGEHRFSFLGSRLCLDFVNTVSGMRLVAPIERLGHYLDLVSWAEQVGVLEKGPARALRAVAKGDEPGARRVLERAIALREALFHLFQASVERKRRGTDDLALVNRELTRALSHRHLSAGEGGLSLRWEEGPALDQMLWPVVDDAARLLSDEALGRVRFCEATATDGCGWLFFDTTKGNTRRWCSMEGCGNRAKARRFHAKAR
jgi:predicted RNA-binding Zn ribbon-like protein